MNTSMCPAPFATVKSVTANRTGVGGEIVSPGLGDVISSVGPAATAPAAGPVGAAEHCHTKSPGTRRCAKFLFSTALPPAGDRTLYEDVIP
jgi:hypothetical protein